MAATQNRGIHIAGTLLAVYRLRLEGQPSQAQLAELIGEDFEKLAKAEQGDQTVEFVTWNIGAIIECCALTGREAGWLLGATATDDFLAKFLRTRRKTKAARNTYRRRLFQSTLLHTGASIRHWLRMVFAENRLPAEVFESAGTYLEAHEQNDAAAHLRLQQRLSAPLVEPEVVAEIRRSLFEACADPENTQLTGENLSQLRLFYARSVANLAEDSEERRGIVRTLEAALQKADKTSRLRRQTAYALAELGRETAMCLYLEDTSSIPLTEVSAVLSNVARRTTDSGNGRVLLELMLRLLMYDALKSLGARVALTLQTLEQVLANSPPALGTTWPAALEDLALTRELVAFVSPFASVETMPEFLRKHACSATQETCQRTAVRHARGILERVDKFYGDARTKLVTQRKIPKYDG